jgi:hypothetical protein
MMQSIVTVTSAADSYDLTTLANVKAELGITNGASDTLLARYITGASKAAMQFCNRVFAVETLSEQFLAGRNWHSPKLQLARYPLTAVTSVTEDEELLTAGEHYTPNYQNGQLLRLGGDSVSLSCWSSRSITAVYSSGYEAVPSDLEDAVIRMVTKRYSAKGRDATLKSEEIPGVMSATYWIATGDEAGNITPDVADILESYRAFVVT